MKFPSETVDSGREWNLTSGRQLQTKTLFCIAIVPITIQGFIFAWIINNTM